MRWPGTGAVWAAAFDLGAGGEGHVAGSAAGFESVSPAGDAYDEVARAQGSDGVPDFSDPADFLASPAGSFEARAQDLDGGTTYRVLARAKAQGEVRLVEALLRREAGGFRPFSRALFSDLPLELSSNPEVDSYDSRLGSYASQVSGKHALENGSVGSNSDIVLNSNVHVWGDATPGPGGTTTIPGSSSVSGSVTPLSAKVDLPPPTWSVPPASDPGVVTTYGYGSSISRTNKGTLTLGPGKYVFDSIYLDHVHFTLELSGTAADTIEIYLTGGTGAGDDPSLWVKKGTLALVPGGTLAEGVPQVRIYNHGKLELDSGPTRINLSASEVGAPGNLIYLSDYESDPSDSSDQGVYLKSNVEFSGAIYAPLAAIECSSNALVYGSALGRKVFVDSNTQLHYDEALAELALSGAGGGDAFVPLTWRTWR